MRFKLSISLDDGDNRRPEYIEDYLRRVADCVGAGIGNGPILDVNGNTIGRYEITDDDDPAT
jgi:hypothetical protein